MYAYKKDHLNKHSLRFSYAPPDDPAANLTYPACLDASWVSTLVKGCAFPRDKNVSYVRATTENILNNTQHVF